MLNLDNNAKLVMSVLGTIAAIAFGSAIVLHCKDKKVAEENHQARLKRTKHYVDMCHTILSMEKQCWWTIKPRERASMLNTDVEEFIEALSEHITKAETERLKKEIGEYVDMKALQKKPKTE